MRGSLRTVRRFVSSLVQHRERAGFLARDQSRHTLRPVQLTRAIIAPAMREREASQVELFVASIGNRDPETESGPTGPLRGARELRPARVVLVALPGVESQADATRKRIAAELPEAEVAVEPLAVRDQVDIDELLHACGRLLDRLTNGVRPDHVAVCASSGTPQLTLALTLATMARAPQALHFQAADPAKTDRPWRPFDPDALRHHAELDAGFRMLEACRFAEAAGLLERRAQSATTAARARLPSIRAALALAQALGHADALRPADAATALCGASVKGLPSRAAEGWQAVTSWYGGFKGARMDWNPRWPVELAARAHRQRTAGRVGEALVAAAIAFEVALAVRLRTAHDLDPEAITLEDRARIPDDLREELRMRGPQKALDPPVYRIEGAQRRSELLRALDPAFLQLDPATRVEPFLNARNLLVHAARRPREELVDDFLRFLGKVCRAFEWGDPAECPSSPAALAGLAAALRPGAGLGPA